MLAQEASAHHSSPSGAIPSFSFGAASPPRPPPSPLCSGRPGRFRPGRSREGDFRLAPDWKAVAALKEGNRHIMCSLFSSINMHRIGSLHKHSFLSLKLPTPAWRCPENVQPHNGRTRGSRPSQSPTRPLASNRPLQSCCWLEGQPRRHSSCSAERVLGAFLSGWPVFQTEKQNTNGSSG